MPGGLLQLISVGQQDTYISISPEFSYWKQVYRRHTNYSMESVRNTFLSAPSLNNINRGIFTCKIGRVGDLLSEVFLCFKLPDIYSDEELRFRWIPNVANHMLYTYRVSIDTQDIDVRYGEWLNVWNELTLTSDKQFGYQKMTGSTEEFIAPKSQKPLVILKNNRFKYSYYPTAGPTSPSIPSRTLYVPLDFWFCKNPALALPLVALQYQTINVTIEFRSAEDLYQVYDVVTGKYYSPSGYRALPHYDGRDVSISAFTAYGGNGPVTVDLNAYLDCNYIFLDTLERNTIAATSMDYLIERVYRTNQSGVQQDGQATIDLVIGNPIKEFVWIMRKSTAVSYNEWGNYTAATPENENRGTMNTLKILWNGAERLQDKPAAYFNLLQPYQYHTSTPKEGIYCYSFALYPEKLQPSGSFNASMINKIQFYLTTNPTDDGSDYEISIYSIYYNIFRVMGGSGGMAFT